ncbi:CMGC protein kinase [Colletotrichum salicis]|uniref:CMGC protein kinase n=1 Tax=Colletotrichum salicis TaxID=1209931 RepID=A0A135V8S8_9PEZI|nr:CMGC protein kinase [Colletotrichum salicis]
MANSASQAGPSLAHVAPPSIHVNDQPQVDADDPMSLLSSWVKPTLPLLKTIPADANIQLHLDRRLHGHAVVDPFDTSKTYRSFWPTKLFEHLLNRQAISDVVKELINEGALQVKPSETSAKCREFWTEKICGDGTGGQGYRLILAILVFLDMARCIKSFVTEGLDDSRLPLTQAQIDRYQSEGGDDSNRPFCTWRVQFMESFYDYQYRLLIPTIVKTQIQGEVSHYNFEAKQVVPWVSIRNRVSEASTDGSAITLGGGFGEVKQIVIHAWQHRFDNTLRELSASPSCFALKRLYISDKGEFDEEVKHLKRFGGRHPHIVTLLATFARQSAGEIEYSLLFPWANCDLLEFWRRKTSLPREHQLCKWIAKQLLGITDALQFIHDPKVLDADGNRLYGRHGDIKPENILWFDSSFDRGNLVLSDLGLTRTHRKESRSNRPGAQIPVSPNYRPPECDIDGNDGRISRSFDIWTLGCLFLEFVVWALEGWEGYCRFKDSRMSPYIHGHDTPVYFEIVQVDEEVDGNKKHVYAVDVKESVTREISRLRMLPNCSQYFHDMLDLIQTRMLIVQSRTPQQMRIAAPELFKRMRGMDTACGSREYCMAPGFPITFIAPHLPVRAQLNEVALRHIASIDTGHLNNIIRYKDVQSRLR